ncbi:DNA/RNA polymerase [Colletotrichum caudatum]|nr:DNA/RNA polymerase [Colletotrichum caudatum]
MFNASRFFHQLGVYPPHQDRMVIISPRGLEYSNVALIGFKNSPAYAQPYINDIVIFSNSDKEHLRHLETILKILNKYRIHIRAQKSFASFPSVKLLRYVVDSKGIRKTDDRIQAFKKLTFPYSLHDLEMYLGIGG